MENELGTHLRHLIAFTLPAESLIVVRIGMGSNIYGLPMHIVTSSFSCVVINKLIIILWDNIGVLPIPI